MPHDRNPADPVIRITDIAKTVQSYCINQETVEISHRSCRQVKLESERNRMLVSDPEFFPAEVFDDAIKNTVRLVRMRPVVISVEDDSMLLRKSPFFFLDRIFKITAPLLIIRRQIRHIWHGIVRYQGSKHL